METRRNTIPPEILLEEYRRIFQEEPQIQELPLLVTGGSMHPFLIGGRDTVYLSRLTEPARRGDVLLYRRDTGGYVLHRVYRVCAEGYTMLGDAQTVPEPGIRQEQILAKVTRAERKGTALSPGCFWWEFFRKYWIRMVPLRPFVCGRYNALRSKNRK